MCLNPLTRHGKNKTVPSVVGKTLDEARTILDEAGFDLELQDSVYTDTAKGGVVLKQVPEGDAVVKISRKVYLTVNSQVPPMVEMPNLIGYSLRNAEMQLKNMGLKIGDTIYKPDFAKNSVLEQWYDNAPIAPGTRIRQGTAIDLVLSDGVGNIEFAVPNLIGLTFCEARTRLQQNGINFGVILPDPDVSDTCAAFITRQSPERYDEDKRLRRIRPGQLMDVWLSKDPPVMDSVRINEEPGLQ
jgi:beta-lactam-binding protein with PASTA domain